MINREQINQLTEEALNSLDGSVRAMPKPYLRTRIRARLQNVGETAWERAGRFITRPAVFIAGFCLVLVINIFVITLNNKNTASSGSMAEQQAAQDEVSNTVAKLYDFENNEP